MGEAIPAPAEGRPELQAIVLKACSFDPKDRYRTAEEMLQALKNVESIDKEHPFEKQKSGVEINMTQPATTVFVEEDAASVNTAPHLKEADCAEEQTASIFSVGRAENRTVAAVYRESKQDAEKKTASAFISVASENTTRNTKQNVQPMPCVCSSPNAKLQLGQNDKQRKIAEESTHIATPIKKAAAKKPNRKKWIWFVVAGISILFIVWVVFSAVGNANEYDEATALLQAGDYRAAKAAFEALNGYKDAKTMVRECDYQAAKAWMDEGQYEHAKGAFEVLAGYGDAATMAKECSYRIANELLAAGEYKAAEVAFEEIGDYEDSKQLRFYAGGMGYIQNGNYYSARLFFEEIDVEELQSAGLFTLGVAYLENGEFDSAKELFCTIKDTELKKEGLYRTAFCLMGNDEKLAAAQIFSGIASYKDAAELRMACIYDAACWYMNNGYYLDALDTIDILLVAEINYEDSAELRENIINDLIEYNKNNGFLRNQYALVGRWSSGAYYFEILYNSTGGTNCGQNISEGINAEYYKFENGIYYLGSGLADWTPVLAFERVDETTLRVRNLSVDKRGIITLTKQE